MRWTGLRLSARGVDLLLLGGVTAALSIVVAADQAGEGAASPLAYLWALGLGLLMLIRRSMPIVVLALTTLGFFTYYMAGFPAIGVAVPIAAAVYSAAEAGRVAAALVTSVLVVGISTAFRLLTGQSVAYVVGYELVGHATLIAAVIALGYTVRVRREIETRTNQVTRLASHQSLLSADRQVREERLRLARELHDSIGHSLSVASLYAGVAEEAPDAASRTTALAQVRSAVRESLGHLQSTVTLLRDPAATAAAREPGLDDIPGLLEPLATAGYDVVIDLAPLELEPRVAAVVFRVIQEGVTNTLRHSDATRIEVTVGADGPEGLHLSLSDDGTKGRSPRFSPGHGLAGMRERVESVGGQLTVESGAPGWRLSASMPRQARP